MATAHRLLSMAVRHHALVTRRPTKSIRSVLSTRLFSTGDQPLSAHTTQSSSHQQPQPRATSTPNPASTTPTESAAGSTESSPVDQTPKPGAIGGFMRGLIGGQSVAVEDAFVAEAKQQGVDLPPPPPQHHATLVPVRRRKRREDEDQNEQGDYAQSMRDRIFGRFGGSSFMQGAFDAKERIKDTIDESDNPVINMFRNMYDRVFAENEMGMVVREIREDDPDFRISDFLCHVETDLVPSILDAYLRGDRKALTANCTQDAYSMLNASIRERETEGIIMDTNILHIADVELAAGRLLEDSPVLIVTFNAQQINCLRNSAGEVVEGSVDDIRAVYYAWAFVREVELEEAEPSGGGMGDSAADGEGTDEAKSEGDLVRPWKLMEMVIRAAHKTI